MVLKEVGLTRAEVLRQEMPGVILRRQGWRKCLTWYLECCEDFAMQRTVVMEGRRNELT